MTLSTELEALRNSLSCCTNFGDQHTHILIKECDPLAKLKSVTLNAPNGDWFSFDPDKGRGRKCLMSPLLSTGSSHSHHRACDCVVIFRRDDGLVALYIDLKSGSPSGYAGQFRSTRQFVRYALGLLSDFHGHELTLAEERFVVLFGGRPALINKTPTIQKNAAIGRTQPDAPYKIEVRNPCTMYLKELLS